MKFTKAISAFAIAALFFTACKKDEETTTPVLNDDVTIEFVTPVLNDLIICEDSIPLEVTISAQEQLHGYEVKLIKTDDNTVVWETHAHVHGTEVTVSDTIYSTVCEDVPAKLEVTAIIDHEGNTKVQTLDVMLWPRP